MGERERGGRREDRGRKIGERAERDIYEREWRERR